MNIQDRLRHCAKHTGLDAVVELLNEAATHIEGLNSTPKLQGDPSWWMRETDEGAEWTDTAPLVLSGWTPLYTTPQPAQATQAEVTDEQIKEAFLANGFTIKDGHSDLKPYVYAAARAILALRPQQSGLTGCNCRWDGDTQVQWCELHLAHKEAIHEWAERAKEAEKQLALRPAAVPMTDEVFDLICNAIDKADTISMEGDYMLDSDDCIAVVRVMQALLSAHHGITAQADLWCIHIPGPDEVHAAPSKEAADHMAAKHNAAMATFYSSGAPNLEFAPSIENVQAVAIKWPYDQQSHADELREFDWSGWGLTKKDDK